MKPNSTLFALNDISHCCSCLSVTKAKKGKLESAMKCPFLHKITHQNAVERECVSLGTMCDLFQCKSILTGYDVSEESHRGTDVLPGKGSRC